MLSIAEWCGEVLLSFAHEKLKVYRKGLDSFAAVQPFLSSWSKQHALVDHPDTANKAVAKLAVSLDMGVRRNAWTHKDIAEAKPLLERIGQMTARKDYG